MDSKTFPLADYFWIAGIDSLQYDSDVFPSIKPVNGTQTSTQVDTTIEEGSESDSSTSPVTATTTPTSPRASARHSRHNSWDRLRLSKLSTNDARSSIGTLDELDKTASNRSSVTIKASTSNSNVNGITNGGVLPLGEFDFDKALAKFANERESFLEDLSFSAGVPTQSRPPMTNQRAERLRFDNGDVSGQGKKSPLRGVGGSIRRRISFKDMNSMKRQPSAVQRSSKTNNHL